LNNSFTYPSADLKIEVAGQPTAGRVSVRFQAAAEPPVLGQPGEQVGEIVLSSSGGAPLLLVSLGKASKVRLESFRAAAGLLAGYLRKNRVSEAQLNLDEMDTHGVSGTVKAVCEGLLLGAFRFERYKSEENNKTQVTFTLVSANRQDEVRQTAGRVEKVASAVNLARDWAHEPANVINPVSLAQRVNELAGKYGLKVTVITDKELEAMGAGAILSVGKGSQTPSRLIIIEYPGQGANPADKPVVLVGKALTFDTGGYSIKTSDGILGMKYDKCGAMAVLGTLVAASQLGLKKRVLGVLGAAENMVSAQAYRPDDILTTLSGKTVEITSTDAEGRLVLADSLTYVQKHLNPRVMIDLATLTGGCVVALGHVRAGLMSNNDELANALYASGEQTYERLWRLPLDEEYDQQIQGNDGDIKNTGGRAASPVIGGIFLKQFVDPAVPWAHLDIAGTADAEKDLPYSQKGATGFGVRLLVDYLEKMDN
jgi:leucyl aminopeptidase